MHKIKHWTPLLCEKDVYFRGQVPLSQMPCHPKSTSSFLLTESEDVSSLLKVTTTMTTTMTLTMIGNNN